jgi:VIT1/CCC1 family predicted Fe2+/Mn2+ transporter
MKTAITRAGPRATDRHRDIQGGAARAAVFGISDGLVTNVGLILGMAGASVEPEIVRVAGFAGLLAGAFSMAAGEYVSVTAQAELLERELAVERRSHAQSPDAEREELAARYVARGVAPEQALVIAQQVMRDPEMALEVHAREELGIDPYQLGSPVGAATSSFLAFCVGAIIPLLPWLFLEGDVAVGASVLLGAIAALVIGAIIGVISERPIWFTSLRQLLVGAVAGAVTYGVGSLLGVQVS